MQIQSQNVDQIGGVSTGVAVDGNGNDIGGSIAGFNGLRPNEEEWVSEVAGVPGVDPDNWVVDLSPATYWLTFEIDSPNDNMEENEGNNTRSESFAVVTPTKVDDISRWWAYSSEVFSVDVEVTAGVAGDYVLDVDVDGLFNDFNLTSDAYATIDSSQTQYNFERFIGIGTGKVTIPNLSAGQHTIHIHSFKAPAHHVVEGVKFQLDGPGSSDDELNALFVSERRGMETIEGFVFEDGFGGSLSIDSLEELVETFVPHLYFDNGRQGTADDQERFAAPFNVDQTWAAHSISGDADQVVDLSSWDNTLNYSAGNVENSTVVDGAIYASVLHDANADEIAINYFLHYPRSDWEEHDGYNTNEGDWEGATLFLGSESGTWLPDRMVYGQHVQVLGIGGGQSVDWDEVRLTGLHPQVFVGLGGHASYPFPGVSTYELPVGAFAEYHDGDLGDPFVPSSDVVHFLPRVGSGVSPELAWLLYPGFWGGQDLGGRGNDDGPRGPVFQDSIFGADSLGQRWLDPWGWSDSFVHVENPGGDGSQLELGKWSVVIHGLVTVNGSYETLTNDDEFVERDPNWMWGLAERINAESRDVAIHTMDARASSLITVIDPGIARNDNNVSIYNEDYHHVLLVDWAEVSNYIESEEKINVYANFLSDFIPLQTETIRGFLGNLVEVPPPGASGEDGYAEATADFLYALFRGTSLAQDVQKIIGHSRGAIVATELGQRLLVNANLNDVSLDQVIFLDAEGGSFHEYAPVPLYSDYNYHAWEWEEEEKELRTDHYFQHYSFLNEPGSLFSRFNILGPSFLHSNDDTTEDGFLSGARSYDADERGVLPGDDYNHSNFPEYLIGNSRDTFSGLFIVDRQIETRGTPNSITVGVGRDISFEAPDPFELFNASFEGEMANSAAGWWYHGGDWDAAGAAAIETGRLILSGGKSRTHNWSYVPEDALSIKFDMDVIGTGAGDDLGIFWSGVDGDFQLIEMLPAASSGTDIRVALPAETSGNVGRIKFSFEDAGTNDNAQLQLFNISWSDLNPEQPSVSVEATDPEAFEEGIDQGVFQIRRAGDRTGDLTIDFSWSDSTATWDPNSDLSDFTFNSNIFNLNAAAKTGSVTIPEDIALIDVDVTPVDDDYDEGSGESIVFRIIEPLMLVIPGKSPPPLVWHGTLAANIALVL